MDERVACPHCSTQNNKNRQICWSCNGDLTRFTDNGSSAQSDLRMCPHCGTQNRDNQSVCWSCAKNLKTEIESLTIASKQPVRGKRPQRRVLI